MVAVTRSAAGDCGWVLATRNQHKVTEIGRILSKAGYQAELVGMDQAAPDLPDIVEDGSTFEANSLLKARAISAATGLPALADDSGLVVDALNGMPGIFSARWSGGHGDDLANLRLVLDQLVDVPTGQRGASFICVAAAVFPAGRELVAYGQVRGELATAPRGDGGFGYDPIFVPTGFSVTTAQLAPEQKDAISHRGTAFRQLAAQLAIV